MVIGRGRMPDIAMVEVRNISTGTLLLNTHRQGCPFSINTLNFMRALHQKSRIANVFHHLTVLIFSFLCFFNFPIEELRGWSTGFYLPCFTMEIPRLGVESEL